MKKKLLVISISTLTLFSCQDVKNINTIPHYSNFIKNKKERFIKVVCLYNENNLNLSLKKEKEVFYHFLKRRLSLKNNYENTYYYNGELKYLPYVLENVVVDKNIANIKVNIYTKAKNDIDFLRKLALSNNLCFQEETNTLQKRCYFISKDSILFSTLKGKKELSSYIYIDDLSEEKYLFYKNLLKNEEIYKISYDIYLLEISKNLLSSLSLSINKLTPFAIPLNNYYLLFDKENEKVKILNKITITLLSNQETTFILGTQIPYVSKMTVSNTTSDVEIAKVTDGLNLKIYGKVLKGNLIYSKLTLNVDTVKNIQKIEAKDTTFQTVTKYTRKEDVSFVSAPGEATLIGAFSLNKNNKKFSLFSFENQNENSYLVLLIIPKLTIYKNCKKAKSLKKVPQKEEQKENEKIDNSILKNYINNIK